MRDFWYDFILINSLFHMAASAELCPKGHDCVLIPVCAKRNQGTEKGISVIQRCGKSNRKICCPSLSATIVTPKNDKISEAPPPNPTGTSPSQTLTRGNGKLLDVRHPDTSEQRKYLPIKTCGRRIYEEPRVTNNKVYGGTDAAPAEVPWIAQLHIKDNAKRGRAQRYCGGTLINKNYIVTAAHCIPFSDDIAEIKITLGMVDTGDNKICKVDENCITDCKTNCKFHELRKGVEWKTHDNFNPTTFDYDVALIRMNAPVEFNDFVQPACLPFKFFKTDLSSAVLLTAGWGKLGRNKKASPILQKTDQHLVPFESCKARFQAYNFSISNKQLCTEGENFSQGLKGDSGGPLLATMKGQYFLVGALSNGDDNWGRKGAVPVRYTDISKFVTWILRRLKP